MIRISMDETQHAFLFKRGKMFKALEINGRILKHHKKQWHQAQADKVICVSCVTPRKTLVVSTCEIKNDSFAPTY